MFTPQHQLSENNIVHENKQQINDSFIFTK